MQMPKFNSEIAYNEGGVRIYRKIVSPYIEKLMAKNKRLTKFSALLK